MAITMMQLLTGLTGFVGCLVCMSLIRTVIGLCGALTAMGVTQETDLISTIICNDFDGNKYSNSIKYECISLFILLCVHITLNILIGKKTAGNLNCSMWGDIMDWLFNLTEYCLAIHLLTFFKNFTKCIDQKSNNNNIYSQFVYDPNVVWDLLVTWITFDTILFIFRIIISYILYRKIKSRGHQRKYVIQ